jgi:hypothetical protein
MKIEIEEFCEKYKVKRNFIQLNSPCKNRLLEPDDEVLEILEEEPCTHIWTLSEKNGEFKIVTGIVYRGAIGYFISSKPWTKKNESYEIEKYE